MNNQNEYAKAQEHLRRVQYKYGSKEYSFPDTYMERIKAYRELFNTGDNLSVGHDVFLYRTHKLEGSISIGNDVVFADNVLIEYSGKVVIGNNVTISDGVKVFSHKHDSFALARREDGNAIPYSTRICDGAWLGVSSIVLSGVTIGEYAVVGAGSVVTHDVAPYCFYAGNPAKFIKELTDNKNEKKEK